MPRINLVPGEKKSRTRWLALPVARLPREISPTAIAGLVALLVLLVSVFLYFGERRALAQTDAAIAEARADSARLHDRVARVRSLEEVQARLAGRVEIMEQVVDGRLFWIELMEAFSATLPEHTWLEKIDQEDLASDQVRIAGGTFANAAVTEYMRGLEASSQLQNTTLIGVNRVEKEDAEYQAFTLIATFEGYRTVVIEPPDTTAGEE